MDHFILMQGYQALDPLRPIIDRRDEPRTERAACLKAVERYGSMARVFHRWCVHNKDFR